MRPTSTRLITDHAASIEQARRELERKHDDAIKELEQQHTTKTGRLAIDYAAAVEQARRELENEYDDVINELKEKHRAYVSNLTTANMASTEQLEVYRLSYLESIRSLVAAGSSGEPDRSPERQAAAEDEPPQGPEELRRQHRKVEELTAAGRDETETNATERERLASQYDRAKEELEATHQGRLEEMMRKHKAGGDDEQTQGRGGGPDRQALRRARARPRPAKDHGEGGAGPPSRTPGRAGAHHRRERRPTTKGGTGKA
ncbi:hypothetical protein DL765_001140 [Monosporascus sp. GIB2]|nr:hypothetical protein DL765_001140 [Monosporascus sp. GIB2]